MPGFSRTSRSVHSRPGGRGVDDPGREGLTDALLVPLLIALNVLTRVQRTLEVVPAGYNATLRETLDLNPSASKILGGMRDRAEVGDIVLVYGELGLVKEVAESSYGYASYRVEYLSEPLLEDVPEDWHVAQHVHRLLDVAGMRTMLEERRGEGALSSEAAEEMLALPDERIDRAFGESAARIWNAGVGMKEEVLAQMRRHQPTPTAR